MGDRVGGGSPGRQCSGGNETCPPGLVESSLEELEFNRHDARQAAEKNYTEEELFLA